MTWRKSEEANPPSHKTWKNPSEKYSQRWNGKDRQKGKEAMWQQTNDFQLKKPEYKKVPDKNFCIIYLFNNLLEFPEYSFLFHNYYKLKLKKKKKNRLSLKHTSITPANCQKQLFTKKEKKIKPIKLQIKQKNP